MSSTGILLGLIARVPADGVAAFNAYEAGVLPLLARHGGVLQRRVRNDAGTVEIHLVWFPSEAAFAAFREDPARTTLAPVLAASGATMEVLRLTDLTDGTAFTTT
ncbi:MAG: hypothetical protein AB7F35_03355 [Acetobacteraceae bacterium]